MQQQIVKVKDKSGKEQNWIIEEELKDAYKIFSNGIITYIYKSGCYTIAGEIFSIETRSNKPSYHLDWFDCINIDKLDKSIDYGYLEDDTYGLDIIYDEDGNKYGL
jgi:hypothetical protein